MKLRHRDLAIAAAKRWRRPVLATDIDPESVRVTRINAARNLVASAIRAETGPGYRHREIARRAPFDLILANILARPLMNMAPRSRARAGAGRRRDPFRPAVVAGGFCAGGAPPAGSLPCHTNRDRRLAYARRRQTQERMTGLQALITAILQGLTELFPVSSLGHAADPAAPARLGVQRERSELPAVPGGAASRHRCCCFISGAIGSK